MDINTVINNTPDIILSNIAERVKEKRLGLNLTQRAFAMRAGVGYDAYRKFETSGEITLRNLVLCAMALGDAEDFETLFAKKAYQSIDELIQLKEPKKRKRGRKQ
ncbi:MAG: helix-turn-helix transcriptional regulator [Paludibacteraceae bacterium]